MKRALLPVLVAAALATSACGGGDTATTVASDDTSSASSATETGSSADAAATPAGPSTNDQVRAACELELVKQAPDAVFANPGTLRVSSSTEGKQYTVLGTVQTGGESQPYTCAVLASADAIEVTEAKLG